MAKLISSDCKLSGSNHGYACNKLDNLPSVMIKMPISSNWGANLTVRSSADRCDFFGRSVTLGGQERRFRTQAAAASDAKMSIGFGKYLRWWEKGIQPNMKEVTGAEDLVQSLLNAGDKLVVVDFFSPGCGGCKALHPKLCQLAEMNPDVQFLQVNYEEHKPMCYSLNVHVLPFFRFYRGAEGRLCSFSCTNATIKKFKDALVKHKPDRCSLGPPKGLEEKELEALGANIEVAPPPPPPPPVTTSNSLPELRHPLPIPLKSTLGMKEDNKDKKLVSFGR